MQMSNRDPAFPVECSVGPHGYYDKQTGNSSVLHSGMSMHDYFVGQALAGLAQGSIVSRQVPMLPGKPLDSLKTPVSAADLAMWAVELADAVMAIRDHREQKAIEESKK